jgi:hypothetical protein
MPGFLGPGKNNQANKIDVLPIGERCWKVRLNESAPIWGALSYFRATFALPQSLLLTLPADSR